MKKPNFEPPPYAYDRSFVLQFSVDSGPGTKSFRGRVEHLRSGNRKTFESKNELLEFIAAALVAPAEGDSSAAS
jgi:hypothetical protein